VLYPYLLYITFVARDSEFFNGVRKYKDKTHLHVVLPYEEVLSTNNIDLLAFKYLYQNLDNLKWMDREKMKVNLKTKMDKLTHSSSN
jgi:hypothetical protein